MTYFYTAPFTHLVGTCISNKHAQTQGLIWVFVDHNYNNSNDSNKTRLTCMQKIQ